MNVVKLFVLPRYDELKPGEDVRILRGPGHPASSLLYKKLPSDFHYSSFTITRSQAEADFFLIPQRMRQDTSRWRSYFNAQKKYADAFSKELILMIGTDLAHTMHVEGAIVFKGSEYRHGIRENEIVTPTFSEDLSEFSTIELRKKSARPLVSFCGYAGFPNLVTRIKYYAKNLIIDTSSIVTRNQYIRAHKRGIYYRRAAIRALSHDPRVETKFIIRDSFSANKITTKIIPEHARSEYIDNMRKSDFVLSPRGDGNASVRFYEALSLGRIPILIDTDMVLPLEGMINYSKCTVRVPYDKIDQIGDIVSNFYASLSDDEFRAMQEFARDTFKKYLRYDSFFNVALPMLKQGGRAAFR